MADDGHYARNKRWAAEREARLEQLRRDVEESREELEAAVRVPAALSEASAQILERTGYVGPLSGWERLEERWVEKRLAPPPVDPELRARPEINGFSAALRRTDSDVAAPTESSARRGAAAAAAEAAEARAQAPRGPREDERAYVGEDLYARGLEVRARRAARAEALRSELEGAVVLAGPRMDPASRRLARARPPDQHAAPTRASLAGRYGAEPPPLPPPEPVRFGHNRWHQPAAAAGPGGPDGADAAGSLYERGLAFAARKAEAAAALRQREAQRALGDSPFVPVRFSQYDPPAASRGSADGAALYERAVAARTRLARRVAAERRRREAAELEGATFRPAMSRGSEASGVPSSFERQRRLSAGACGGRGRSEPRRGSDGGAWADGHGGGGSWSGSGFSEGSGSGSGETGSACEGGSERHRGRVGPRAAGGHAGAADAADGRADAALHEQRARAAALIGHPPHRPPSPRAAPAPRRSGCGCGRGGSEASDPASAQRPPSARPAAQPHRAHRPGMPRAAARCSPAAPARASFAPAPAWHGCAAGPPQVRPASSCGSSPSRTRDLRSSSSYAARHAAAVQLRLADAQAARAAGWQRQRAGSGGGSPIPAEWARALPRPRTPEPPAARPARAAARERGERSRGAAGEEPPHHSSGRGHGGRRSRACSFAPASPGASPASPRRLSAGAARSAGRRPLRSPPRGCAEAYSAAVDEAASRAWRAAVASFRQGSPG